jgi:hypothetical protein
MKYLLVKNLFLMALVSTLSISCGKSKAPAPQNLDNSEVKSDDAEFAPFDQDCRTEKRCKALNLDIQGVDQGTQDINVTAFRGETGVPLTWGARARVTVAETGQDISEGIINSNRLMFSVEQLPASASNEQASSFGLLFNMNSTTPSSGSFIVKVRDVGRCQLLQTQNNRDASLCSDMSKNIIDGSLEQKKTFSFVITENAQNIQLKIRLQQLEQQCKNATTSTLIQALPGLLTGNILGTGISAGIGAMTTKQQCEAEKQQILNQMNSNSGTTTTQ